MLGSAEEFMFYTELAQRGFAFTSKRHTGLTAVYPNLKNVESPWDHPLTFETYGEIVGGCEMSRVQIHGHPDLHDNSWDYDEPGIANAIITGMDHYFFFRKVKGDPEVVAAAITACAGLSNRTNRRSRHLLAP